MTEDDTFRKLSRPSIYEMVRLYDEWDGTWNPGPDRIKFMEKYGWGWLEFLLASRHIRSNIKP